MTIPHENSITEDAAIGIAAVLDPVHYPALVRALNALWDLPTTPVRRSCMDALVVMIDDFEAQAPGVSP